MRPGPLGATALLAACAPGPADVVSPTTAARAIDVPGVRDATPAAFGDVAPLRSLLLVRRAYRTADEWNRPDPVRLRIEVTIPRLSGVAAGSGQVVVPGVWGAEFAATVGRGRLALPDLRVGRLRLVDIDGELILRPRLGTAAAR